MKQKKVLTMTQTLSYFLTEHQNKKRKRRYLPEAACRWEG